MENSLKELRANLGISPLSLELSRVSRLRDLGN